MKGTEYTVMAWLVDKRCHDNCNLKAYHTCSEEDAYAWAGKIKKAWGDSVILIERTSDNQYKETYIELREDQMVKNGEKI